MTSHLSQPCGKRGFSRMRALPTKVGWLPILAIWNKPKKHPEMDIKHEKKKQKLRHAYRGIQLTSIIINFGSISTSFWTPDFFLDHAMPFAFRPVIFERHRPGPHNCERARWPWAGRALEGKGEEAGRAPTGGAKMVGFFHPKKWTPKKCIRTFPNNPLLGSPAIGFFLPPPTGGCYGELLLPPQKNGRYLFWSEWPLEKHVVAIFLRTRKFQHPGNYTFLKATLPLVQWGFLGWRRMVIDVWCLLYPCNLHAKDCAYRL